MSKKRSTKIKRWYRSNKKTLWLLCLLFIFPLVVGGIYALPLPRIIALNSGDLLAYYGTTFGIIGTFITYRNEVKKKKKERIQELKPFFTVEVSLVDKSLNLFKIDINNHSEQPLSYFFFMMNLLHQLHKRNIHFKLLIIKQLKKQNL